jgi:hypothetical protein
VVKNLGLDPRSKLADISSLVPLYLLDYLQDPGADNCSSNRQDQTINAGQDRITFGAGHVHGPKT